jgi:hypothetical protein
MMRHWKEWANEIKVLGKRATYVENMIRLDQIGHVYKLHNRGLHVIMNVGGERVYFWPSTGNWTHNGRKQFREFTQWLEEYIDGREGYREEVKKASEEHGTPPWEDE